MKKRNIFILLTLAIAFIITPTSVNATVDYYIFNDTGVDIEVNLVENIPYFIQEEEYLRYYTRNNVLFNGIIRNGEKVPISEPTLALPASQRTLKIYTESKTTDSTEVKSDQSYSLITLKYFDNGVLTLSKFIKE